MTLPEDLEVQSSDLTTILAEEGPTTPPKIEFVLKCLLGNIKWFKLMYFFSKKKGKIIPLDADPTHPP